MADQENEVTSSQPPAEGDDADVEEVELEGGDPSAAAAAMIAQSGITIGDISLTSQALQNPQVLAALQDRLGNIMGQSSGYVENLPKVVKRRIKALKNLQVQCTKIEAKFYEEVHQLECKYAKQYQPLFERRRDIVTGTVEPTDSDCEWESDEEDEEDAEGKTEEEKLVDDLKEKAKLTEDDKEDAMDENVEGIPEFWLTVFKNCELINDMVQEHDENILKHLTDVTVNFTDVAVDSTMGFTLLFHFEANDYFSNTVLTKFYEVRSEPDDQDPFAFEGPEIISCKGCQIDWKKGKNVTVKVVKKKQKHKGRGTTRMVTKTIQNDSFFNFFNPPQVPEDGSELDDDAETILAADFEIGHFFRERIVPKAVLYFTGEAMEDEEYEEEEGEEGEGECCAQGCCKGEEEGEEGEDDEEHDPDWKPPAGPES
ncbi:nucleosome assembly protein 1-like 1 isoform X2 [Branchiostoma floridae]|uniref:Nucleosome assembly protein 1-like 1 isoform X2 n=1 Tax=Branchiostoma floridae TaxID=7739 RepID=A0A9J7MLT7_BRAFL|nr:nucleosome assembly protein 1-like 1 isoform X2 [Branchiostoma floridae]